VQGRDFNSVHLSLLQYLSVILAPPWDVQPQRREPQTRPLAVCRPVGPSPSAGTAYLRDYTQAYEVLAYPPAAAEGDVRGSGLIAAATKGLLLRAFDTGAGTGRFRGYSMRVPLFDFTGVADDEDLPVDALPIDYLVLSNLDGEARQDPERDDLYTVLIDFRVSWRDDGDLRRFEGAVLEGVGLRPAPVEGP
jgi:hypothetical protein